MGSSFLTGTACMGIRIATAPSGPRNDRRCYIVRRDSLSSSVIARSEATRQSVFSVGTACTHLSVGLEADSSPQGEPWGCLLRQDILPCRNQKTPSFRMEFSVLALPIFPASHPASIVGEGVLNFCVRDGNRWTHTPINTNFISFEHSVVP